MILQRLYKSAFDEMNNSSLMFVAACGYESRSSALASRLSKNIKHRVAACFDEYPSALAREENERIFRENGFDLIPCPSNDLGAFNQIVSRAIAAATEAGKPLAIDISSMTRVWHGALIRTILLEETAKSLEVYFVYTPALFQTPPPITLHNEIVSPVDGFVALAPPDAPVGLVLGLGYESERAVGLNEFLDPGRTVIMIPFYPPKETDPYYPEILANNSELLCDTSTEWIYEYPVNDPVATFGMLESVCHGLQSDLRVVVASLGPKIFGIISFLVAAKHRDISIWRASTGINAPPRDAKADLSRVVIFRSVWARE